MTFAGLVQKFLSAKFWIPLSRLTYSVYLIHLIVIEVMFFDGLGTIHYDTYTVVSLTTIVRSTGYPQKSDAIEIILMVVKPF